MMPRFGMNLEKNARWVQARGHAGVKRLGIGLIVFRGSKGYNAQVCLRRPDSVHKTMLGRCAVGQAATPTAAVAHAMRRLADRLTKKRSR